MNLETYEGLQKAIASYLNKKNLTEQIPIFIELAENEIFRTLRCPLNEVNARYQDVSGSVKVPKGYLELKYITFDGRPLERISDSRLLDFESNGEVGQPKYFARKLSKFYFYPSPDHSADVDISFYSDLSGNVDDSPVFLQAPDLYLYGALIQAYVYLGGQRALQKITDIQPLYERTFQRIETMTKQAEYSGSTLKMGSPYG